jgi:hypothetical protein
MEGESGRWYSRLLGRWRLGILLSVELIILVWIWVSARNTTPQFPQSLLTVEGFLLTATVFIISFVQSRHRRAVDESLSSRREYQTALVEAYDKHPKMITSLRLYEIAAAHASEAERARWLKNKSIPELIDAMNEQRSLPARRDQLDNLGWNLLGIQDKLKEADTDDAGRQVLERDRIKVENRYDGLQRQVKKSAQASRSYGSAALVDLLRTDLGATFDVLRVAFVFASVIVTLGLIGAVYAGWGFSGTPAAEVWAVGAIVGLALAYISVVRRDVVEDKDRVLDVFATAPLAALYDIEQFVIAASVRDSGIFQLKYAWERIQNNLPGIERELPGLPWIDSLRGRELLHQAESLMEQIRVNSKAAGQAKAADPAFESLKGWIIRTLARINRTLADAEQLLRAATNRGDDPVAAVALARTLELHMEWDPHIRPYLSHEADRLVRAAVEMLRPPPPDDISIGSKGTEVVWDWLCGSRSWLWPKDDARVNELEGRGPESPSLTVMRQFASAHGPEPA